MLKYLINKTSNTFKLLTAIDNKTAVSIFGLNLGEKLSLLNDTESVLYVAPTEEEAVKIFETLKLAGKNVQVILNKLSYESIGNNELVFAQALGAVLTKEIQILIVTPEVLLSKLPDPNDLLNQTIILEVGKSFKFKSLKKQLITMGYKHSEVVANELEFNFKGDLLSIFPLNQDNPIRVSFFGDEIEYIKSYNIEKLNIINEIDELKIFTNKLFNSFSEFPIIKENFSSRVAEENFIELTDKLKTDFENNNVSIWLAPYFGVSNRIFDYFKSGHIVFDSPKQIVNMLELTEKESADEIKTEIETGNLTKKHKQFYFYMNDIFQFDNSVGLISFQNINTANKIFKPNAVFNINTTPLLNYNFYSATLVDDVIRYNLLNFTVVLYAQNNEFANKLKEQFLQKRKETYLLNSVSQVTLKEINIIPKSGDYSYCFTDEKILVINLTNKKNVVKNKQISSTGFNGFLPQVNDYVVHNNFGIGKCIAITKLNVNNAVKDYVEIEYKNSDKLFLPVENIDSLTKYVGSDKTPKLNKLGSGDFIKTKQKVKAKLKQLTFDLKKLYAEREQIKGIQYPADDDIQLSFESSFPYALTLDQEKAITEVKKDMSSGKVMDRLICGDVGFGKTEVALRAAFKAVMAGYQVMFLCPTTILSEQHYNTCVSRMQEFGVRVEVLNRFKTKQEVKQILAQLLNGEIDIICGTHRLLSADIKLKNLGLLILDEEQRFGVEHKEKIKKLKNNIDVLTLSATPIPRTMHIALIGVKDISTIETAPMQRIPVISQVSEYSDSQTKFFIERELNRGGQVLIVYNRVEDIFEFSHKIKTLMDSDVVIDVAHGQMDEKTLEDSIFRLYNGTTQILVSTTLIENGIDLPNANTLIIINADMLGLGQLYQLKGRIGRSDKQAYALFTYNKGKVLTEEAYKRMGAIMEYSGLGNGFKIAMRDLEIRGAGSVFGAEQSGHIESVGYSLYLTLLADAVAESNGGISKIMSDVKIDCYFDANLPSYYVEGSSNRIEIYSEISKLSSESEQSELIKKLEFNFGNVPEEVINLCYIARIKNIAKTLNIARVSLGVKETKINFNELNNTELEKVIKLLNNNPREFVLNLEKSPIITVKNKLKIVDTLQYVINSLLILANF